MPLLRASAAAARGEAGAMERLRSMLPPQVARCRHINVASRTGVFPLHAAADVGSPETVQALLAGRANPNIHGGRGVGTALQAAVAGGHAEVVRLLLDSGADPNRCSSDPRAPPSSLLLAERNSGFSVRDLPDGSSPLVSSYVVSSITTGFWSPVSMPRWSLELLRLTCLG